MTKSTRVAPARAVSSVRSRLWGDRPRQTVARDLLPPAYRDATDYPSVDIVGAPDVLRLPAIAIVGTRALPVRHVRWVGEVISDVVTACGRVVVSGGANGVDAIAHRAAVDAGLPSVVVLASGVERAGPASNRPLFHSVVDAGGAVLGFGEAGRRPFKGCFLKRNVSIAAAAQLVVVAAAPTTSGALSTAAAARRMGIPVLAVPGPALDPVFAGCHHLIRTGARICTGGPDALSALGEAAQMKIPMGTPARPAVEERATRLFEGLNAGRSVDEMTRDLGVSAQEAQRLLLELRLAGFQGV